MAKSCMLKKNSILKIAVQKVQKSLLLSGVKCTQRGFIPEEAGELNFVPGDVKEGHFAVLAVRGEEPRRFVVSLRCLSNPKFLQLLEMAEEEFGLRHEGAIALPCYPSQLERIIMDSGAATKHVPCLL